MCKTMELTNTWEHDGLVQAVAPADTLKNGGGAGCDSTFSAHRKTNIGGQIIPSKSLIPIGMPEFWVVE